MENNKINGKDPFPEIEFLDEIEFETDIQELEEQKHGENTKSSKKSAKNKDLSSTKKSSASKAASSSKKSTPGKKNNSQNDGGDDTKKAKKKVKKSRKFKRGLLIYVAALAVLIIGVWIFFYSFIDGYEKGMAYNKIAQIAAQANENGIETILEDVEASNDFEDKASIIEYVKKLVLDKDITYKESKETTPNEPVYELCVDKKAFAKVYLKQDGYIKHHFKNWVIQTVDVADYLPEGSDITVLVTNDSTLYINDKAVDDTYITMEEATVDALVNVEQYLSSVPKVKKYEVKGFIETPVVKVVDADGNSLPVSQNEKVYEVGYSNDSATESEFATYVGDVSYAYARNFANLGKNIFNYIMPNSDLYANIESATTYFYPDSKISNTEFTSREITDFIRYSEDCFTCHVKYEYTIYFTGYSIDKDVSSVDMIWTFVNYNGLWYLTNTKYY
jgi:hypothetical protein